MPKHLIGAILAVLFVIYAVQTVSDYIRAIH